MTEKELRGRDMTEKELREKYDAFRSEACWGPDIPELVDLMGPWPTPPTDEYLLLLAMALGWGRDTGAWYRRAAAPVLAGLMRKCCDADMSVEDAANVVAGAAGVGAEEYGG